MTEMVERVAAAMSHKDMPGVPVGLQKYRAMARAALREMREPTQEMVDQGFDVHLSECWPGSKDVWQAMIDAALKE